MPIQIAIPQPSCDPEYNGRSLSPYLRSLEAAGAHAVVVHLDQSQEQVARLLCGTHGVLLPGSRYDVDPERYGAVRIAECGPSDPSRAAVDELLLQDAFNLRKPVLAICQGIQMLNVWLNGTLIQDLDRILHTPVNHRPGRDRAEAHTIEIAAGTRLSRIASADDPSLTQWCNSSHHQAIDRVGDQLQVSAVCPQDGVVEAVEVPSADHFVIGVQWHPERTYTTSRLSRGIFEAFVRSAEEWEPQRPQMAVAL